MPIPCYRTDTSVTGIRRVTSRTCATPSLSGTGFVEENVAYEFTSLPQFTSTHSIEHAIGSLEWQMMNNDSACCANGHRDNILTPYHNRVSIGVAYDATHVYFVEDFETFLTSLNTPISQGNSVSLVGNTSGNISPTSILIFYDPTPDAAHRLAAEFPVLRARTAREISLGELSLRAAASSVGVCNFLRE